MDSRLTEVLVCPVCKGPLAVNKAGELVCTACRLGFPLDGEIPVMLTKEARELTPEEQEAARIKPAN